MSFKRQRVHTQASQPRVTPTPVHARVLRALIAAAGCDLADLALVTGYDASYISRFRTGERSITPESWRALCSGLGVPALSYESPGHWLGTYVLTATLCTPEGYSRGVKWKDIAVPR